MTILQMCQIRPHLAGYFSPLKDHEFGESTTLWRDLTQVWDAIDKGNRQWQIPAYNGGLFSSDPGQSPDGALFTKIQIPDRALGPALKHLLIDTTSDGVDGPVDFRSLSVREFGTIYEGLLESSLSKAEQVNIRFFGVHQSCVRGPLR